MGLPRVLFRANGAFDALDDDTGGVTIVRVQLYTDAVDVSTALEQSFGALVSQLHLTQQCCDSQEGEEKSTTNPRQVWAGLHDTLREGYAGGDPFIQLLDGCFTMYVDVTRIRTKPTDGPLGDVL